MDDRERIIARYARVGMDADAGKTALLAASDGLPVYFETVQGDGLWLAAFSERTDVGGGVQEVLCLPLATIFQMQAAANAGNGIVLDPYTDPLWIPNGMIPVLLDAGRHELFSDLADGGEE